MKDFEPYFDMWNSVLYYPNPALKENQLLFTGHQGDGGSFPCHEHKTCKGKVKALGPFPPRVCPHCYTDTAIEVKAKEIQGAVGLP